MRNDAYELLSSTNRKHERMNKAPFGIITEVTSDDKYEYIHSKDKIRKRSIGQYRHGNLQLDWFIGKNVETSSDNGWNPYEWFSDVYEVKQEPANKYAKLIEEKANLEATIEEQSFEIAELTHKLKSLPADNDELRTTLDHRNAEITVLKSAISDANSKSYDSPEYKTATRELLMIKDKLATQTAIVNRYKDDEKARNDRLSSFWGAIVGLVFLFIIIAAIGS